ncbi:MAG TPA: hypothetical protein VFE70_00965 [Candidatus Elarobacter sp.]|jgi:hypothetical protein|nr:hypothetical protein [Candidatus Elarobacter sp.]
MQHVFSIIAAAAALSAPQTGIVQNAPVAISTCAVSELVNPAILAEYGPPIATRMVQLSFVNTDDAVATEVTFDLSHDGAHSTVTDRGRFSKGVPIERLFDGLGSTDGGGVAACAVVSVTFADGHRWTAPAGEAGNSATLR